MRAAVLLGLMGLFLVTESRAASDFLAQRTVQIESERSADALSRLVAAPKAVFERFRLRLDDSTKITRPQRVSGPDDRPVLQVSVKKCVGFICKDVDLDAAVSVRETRGSCDQDFTMVADLRRSSRDVRDVYDRLDVKICYKARPDGRGSLVLSASLNHGPAYSKGFVQGEMFKLLQLQVDPIVKAVQDTLRAME